MNLNSLFPKQSELDKHIVEKHNLQDQDLLNKKAVALICELYELVNELQFFKFWKTDIKIDRNKAVEEYIDVIHFTLSIANDLGYTSHKYIPTQHQDLNKLVLGITNAITVLSVSPSKDLIGSIFNNIVALGYQIGLTEEDVLEIYNKKNEVNFARQESGY